MGFYDDWLHFEVKKEKKEKVNFMGILGSWGSVSFEGVKSKDERFMII